MSVPLRRSGKEAYVEGEKGGKSRPCAIIWWMTSDYEMKLLRYNTFMFVKEVTCEVTCHSYEQNDLVKAQSGKLM